MSKDSSTLVPQPIEEKDAPSKPSFEDTEIGPGPALTEKSESRHISVPREDEVPAALPEKPKKGKKLGRLITKIFCCRRDTTINTTTPIINDIPTTSTNINTANIGTTRSYPNTSSGAGGGGELLKSGTDSPAHVSRRSSFSHSNPVTQQIVLAPEREVQQQIVVSAAVTAAAHAGGDETVQHELARKSGEAEARLLLPPLAKDLVGKKCLVLDLDETLVHSSFKLITQADFVVPVEIENQAHNVYVLKRPGVDEFMRQVGEYFEIVVFTASLSKYADPVLDLLDRYQVVHHRLFRESCLNYKGNYVKDLSQLGRDLRSTLIIDNSPASYILHPTNAVPVTSWFSDPHDTELLDMIPFLIDLSKVDDVTQVLDGTQDIFGDEEEEEAAAAADFSPETMADDQQQQQQQQQQEQAQNAPTSSVVNPPLLVR